MHHLCCSRAIYKDGVVSMLLALSSASAYSGHSCPANSGSRFNFSRPSGSDDRCILRLLCAILTSLLRKRKREQDFVESFAQKAS